MRVLAVTADASLQVALASMMPDWDLRALTDATDAVDAGDAAVALVDLGTTARGLEAARALSTGLNIPCVVIGEDDVDDDIARIIVRPFTLSELGEAVTRAAEEGPRRVAAVEEEVVLQEAVEQALADAERLGSPEAEPLVTETEETPVEPPPIVLTAAVPVVEEPEPAPEMKQSQRKRKIKAEEEASAEAIEPTQDHLAPVVDLRVARLAPVETDQVPEPEAVPEPVVAEAADEAAPSQDVPGFDPMREAMQALADISTLPFDRPARPQTRAEMFGVAATVQTGPVTEPPPEPVEATEIEATPEPEADPAPESEATPEPEAAPEPEVSAEPVVIAGPDSAPEPSRPVVIPLDAPAPDEDQPSRTVEYVRALLAELDHSESESALALAGRVPGVRVARERAIRPVAPAEIVPEPAHGRRRLRRRAHRSQQTETRGAPGSIENRLSVALWAARDLEALVQEMPVLCHPRAIAHTFLGTVVDMFGSETAAVYVKRSHGGFVVLAPHGLSQIEAGVVVPDDQPLFREVASAGHGVFIAPVDLAQGLVAGIGGARTETLMAAPLEAAGECVAVAVVGGAAHTEADLGILCEMAAEAAPGLAFALLVERLRARL